MDDHLEITRRQAVGVAGAAGVALLVGGVRGPGGAAGGLGVDEAVAATCVMTPAKTVGPYFVEEELNRSDVREDQAGAPLTLTLYVFDADNDCAPVKGAQVDIWHANAFGLYSDESANGTAGKTWLRGFQTTDDAGKVTFTTVYPGWYSGRAVHIHFKVRVYDGTTETLEFTSQMFFTDDMNKAVFASQAPYTSRGTPDTTDTTDTIYGGDSVLLLRPVADGSGGYATDFSAGVAKSTSQLGNTSAGAGGPGGGGGPGGTPPTRPTNPATGTTTTTPDEVVNGSVGSVKALRTAAGTRQYKLSVKHAEPVAVTAKLTRNGKTLVQTRSKTLATSGTQVVKVTLPAKIAAGAATLRITLTDASLNTATVKRTVHVASRRR